MTTRGGIFRGRWYAPPPIQDGLATLTIGAVRNATFNVTIDPVTLAATGDVDINATFAQTIAAVTLSATGKVILNGSLASTIDPVTLAATGKVIISGTFAQTIDPVTLAASGDVDITGTFGQTIAAVTLSAAGDVDIKATFGVTIDSVTLAANGSSTLVTNGTFAVTIDPVTLSAAGDVDIRGTLGVTIDPVTLSANATVSGGAISGTFDQTIAAFTLAATATISQPPVVPGIPDTGGSGNASHGAGRRRNLNDDEDRFAELLKEWRARREASKNIETAYSPSQKGKDYSPDRPSSLQGHRDDGIESAAASPFVDGALDSDLLERVRQAEATFDRAMQSYEAAQLKAEQARVVKAKAKKAAAAQQARQAALEQEQQARAQAMQLAIEWEMARLAYEDMLDEEDEIFLLAA